MARHPVRRDDRDIPPMASAWGGGLAWQWLRRDPGYRALCLGPAKMRMDGLSVRALLPHDAQDRWGCLAAEPADRDDAPVLWSAAVDPSVLALEAFPARPGDCHILDPRSHASLIRLVAGRQCEHVLIGTGPAGIRLDIVSGTLLDGPIGLSCPVGWGVNADRQLVTLRRLIHFCRTGCLLPVRPRTCRVHRRAGAALHVHDALMGGASIRDIGILLYGADRVEAEWTAPGESLKSSCRRLIALARDLAAGGYKRLIGLS